MKEKPAARGAALAVALALLLLAAVVAAVLMSSPGENQVNGSDDETRSEQGTVRNNTTTTPNPGNPSSGSTGGRKTNPSRPTDHTGAGPGASAPSLPSGDAASHEGKARLTTTVSGQSYTIEVAVSVKLDQAGGYSFAYAGTGTVPVNLGADVAATADYAVNGSFSGTLDGEAFSGSGPATIQATVKVPGMSPQSGNSTEQLTIKGSMHEVDGGGLEGDFAGGSYAGTFWADAV
jgi:hypothetical protein